MKAAHLIAGAGIIAIVTTKLALTAIVSYRKGVRVGERRVVKRLAAGEMLEDLAIHKGHHHHECCAEGTYGRGMRGSMRRMMGKHPHPVETDE